MHNIGLVLLAFAFVFAVFAACGVEQFNRFHLGWCAIAFYIAAQLIGGLGPVFR